MEKKKNIIYLAGIDTYGVRHEKGRWKKVFREKHAIENIEEIRIEEVKDWSRIEQDMQSIGLFTEKRLWCFSGGFPKQKKEETPGTRKKKGDGSEDIILRLCEHIGDDHFFLFSGLLFDEKKGTLIPWLTTHADVRRFDTLWSVDTWRTRFPELESDVIKSVLTSYRDAEVGKEYTSTDLSDAIGGSLEKLSLLGMTHPSASTIEESLDRAFSGKIFDLIDMILSRQIESSRRLLTRILETMTPYEFLPILIGSLRGSVYVKYLQHQGKKEKEIATTIPIHPYVLSKTLRTPISYGEILEIYTHLIDANIAYKSGKGMKDPELGRIFAIERALFGLKKK